MSAFVSEEQLDYKRLLSNKDEHLSVIKKNDVQSPFYFYSQADIYLQCAFVKIKFGEYTSCALDLMRANSLLKKNRKLFPKFILNLKGLGMLHSMAGAVPTEFQWLSSIAGFEGTIEEGVGELDSLFTSLEAADYDFLKPEVALLLFYLKTNFENVSNRNIITALFSDSTLLKNPLVAFSYSGFLMKTGKAEEAIEILQNADKSRELPFFLIEYRLGYAKFCRGDEDAIGHLLKFASSFKGKNYLRSGFRFIAWYYLLNNDEKKYKQFINDVLLTGNTFIDEDKDATREAKGDRIPNKRLLRARLFYDGGLFINAADAMKNSDGLMLKDKIDSVEYDYRSARIAHAMADTSGAIVFYIKAFTDGKTLRYYYAANSALQLGRIYERRKEKEKAKEWFEKCLNLPAHDYKTSIDQKAKSGLERVK
ncbi:MAG: hypothetical protein JJE25_03280 [Bacteroidia bacterium]|nr:hypothetical protein [Bacteroidia bacterium]